MPNMPSDTDIVLAVYTSGNKGQHKVVGAATHRVYGHYKGGDRLYVHVRDIAAQPHLFQPVQNEIPVPRESRPQEIPEPKPIQEIASTPAATPPPVTHTHPIEEVQEEVEPQRMEVPEGFDVLPISLEELPGISPQILQYLNAGGIHNVDQLRNASVEELVRVKGIGESRAKAIREFVDQYFEVQSS